MDVIRKKHFKLSSDKIAAICSGWYELKHVTVSFMVVHRHSLVYENEKKWDGALLLISNQMLAYHLFVYSVVMDEYEWS